MLLTPSASDYPLQTPEQDVVLVREAGLDAIEMFYAAFTFRAGLHTVALELRAADPSRKRLTRGQKQEL
jgi:hypothetical protein